MKNGNLHAAFEAMAAEVESTIQSLNNEGSQAFLEGDYERARGLMEQGPALLEFQSKFNALWEEWREILGVPAPSVTRSTTDSAGLGFAADGDAGANGGEAQEQEEGLRPPDARSGMTSAAAPRRDPESHTGEEKFVLPILQALVSMGGAGSAEAVLEHVGEIMKSRLNRLDHEPVDSDPEKPRWRFSAEWAGEAMTREGLLDWDEALGGWRVTEVGKKWLAKQFETT